MENETPELTKKERRALKREEKKIELEKVGKVRKGKNILILAASLIVFLGIVFGGFKYISSSPTNIQADLTRQCVNHAAAGMHIHPRLEIEINGEERSIPANIGVSVGCMKPLHTHDASGTLHIEFQRPHDFTLGDFFRVWDKEFSELQIFDFKVDEEHSITMTVDSEPNEEYENHILKDGERIVISYE